MIPIMTLDLATAFATFGWGGGGLVLAGLGAILVALIGDGRAKPEADAENVATPDDLRPAAPLARSGGDSLQLDSALAPARCAVWIKTSPRMYDSVKRFEPTRSVSAWAASEKNSASAATTRTRCFSDQPPSACASGALR